MLSDHIADVVVGVVVLLVSGLFGLIVWSAKKWMREEITRATYPIQRHANGGLSLPDVAKSAARTESKIDDLLTAVGALQGGLSTHLINHAK